MAALPRYQTILVGVDLSASSRDALAHAIALAQATSARLEVVHVVEKLKPALPYSRVNRAVVTRLQKDMLESAREALSRFLPEVKGVKLRSRVVSGASDEILLRWVGRVHADLVVLARQGHSALEEFLLGSTAERVMRRCKVPVLLVPPSRRRRSRR